MAKGETLWLLHAFDRTSFGKGLNASALYFTCTDFAPFGVGFILPIKRKIMFLLSMYQFSKFLVLIYCKWAIKVYGFSFSHILSLSLSLCVCVCVVAMHYPCAFCFSGLYALMIFYNLKCSKLALNILFKRSRMKS